MDSPRTRQLVKHVLATGGSREAPRGVTILTYHRVGGRSRDERDVDVDVFLSQLDELASHQVVALDDALDALDAGNNDPMIVLTFDDGFADVHENAWPHLASRGLPFTLYVATAFMGGHPMTWEGSTATDAGTGLGWDALQELATSPLCTIGNHTHSHVIPQRLCADEVDRCSEVLERRLGVQVRHFAYPWGIPVQAEEVHLRTRFRSSVTGEVGRNLPSTDRHRLRRVPVRRTDPRAFFLAKLRGDLGPERAYDRVVRTVKRLGLGRRT